MWFISAFPWTFPARDRQASSLRQGCTGLRSYGQHSCQPQSKTLPQIVPRIGNVLHQRSVAPMTPSSYSLTNHPDLKVTTALFSPRAFADVVVIPHLRSACFSRCLIDSLEPDHPVLQIFLKLQPHLYSLLVSLVKYELHCQLPLVLLIIVYRLGEEFALPT